MHSRRTYSLALKGWSLWLSIFGVIAVLRFTGLGWLAAALLGLLLFLLLLPVLVLVGFRWWMQRLLASDNCPVCDFHSEAVEGQRFECPNCRTPLYVADGQFFRQTPPGTIDVDFAED